jgi:hypothetical protein
MRMVVRGEETRNSLVLHAGGRFPVITMIWIIEVSEVLRSFVYRTEVWAPGHGGY